MAVNFLKHNQSKTLKMQIRDAERCLLQRQRQVNRDSTTLILEIKRLMIAPESMLLASMSGFIIGELTNRQACNFIGTAKSSPLEAVFTLMSLARTINAVLPLACRVK